MKNTELAFVAAVLAAAPAWAQVLRVQEMNTRQIAALDRAKTAMILPGGILEEHGPYLPSFADGGSRGRERNGCGPGGQGQGGGARPEAAAQASGDRAARYTGDLAPT